MEKSDYRVLVAEKISLEGVKKLRERFEVDSYDKMPREELLQQVAGYDALVVRSGTRVDSEVIEGADRLKIIGRAGIGVDNIDVDAATRRGIIVANVPESNIISAAEHTMAMILSLARKIPGACSSLAGGDWKRSDFQGVELYGKTLGIVGLGRIGALVAERADGFGMKIIGYDPFITEERARRLGIELKNGLDDVLAESDFITFHVPKNAETYHMLSTGQFDKVKDGVRIVNVSRGGVVDEEALREAIEAGKVAGAAIDVFENEPPGDSPLCRMEQVVVTPHLGASTTEAQYKAGVAIAEQVISGLEGGFVSTAINIAMPHREVAEALKPFLPLCEKLGRLITRLADSAVSEIELEIRGEIGEHQTSLLTVALLKGFFDKVYTDSVTYVNAPILAQERGMNVKETRSRHSQDYVNLIVAKAGTKEGQVKAGATMVGTNQELFVGVLDYDIEIAPSEFMAFVQYEDRPGMIGRIGTILGEHEINIASLQVGREQIGGYAAMGLALDSPVPQEVLSQLESEDGVRDAIFISL